MKAIIVVLSVLIGIPLLVWLLLWLKIKVIYEIIIKPKEWQFNAKLKIGFVKVSPKTIKKEKKKVEKEEKNLDEIVKNTDFNEIYAFKDDIFIIFKKIMKIMKNSLVIEEISTDVKCALTDPMENGILYGAFNSILNCIYAILINSFNMKKYYLDISYDFYSMEGLIFKNNGTLYLRPCKLLNKMITAYLKDTEFKRSIKKIIKIFIKSKDEKNGKESE